MRHSGSGRRIAIAGVALAVIASACSSTHHSVTKPAGSTTTTAPTRTVACTGGATTPTIRHLASSKGSVWVWIEAIDRPTSRVGGLIKIVWRMTGTGAPRASLSNPTGRAARLSFGPEPHGQSTFHHPGAEYGTGFTPTSPGCWQLTMRRGDVTGSLSFSVR